MPINVNAKLPAVKTLSDEGIFCLLYTSDAADD